MIVVDMDVENFKNTNRNVTIRFEIYNWQQGIFCTFPYSSFFYLVGNHEFLGCHTSKKIFLSFWNFNFLFSSLSS